MLLRFVWQQKATGRRKSSLDALNYTATGNRQVEIRQKLYEEFNMPRRTSHSRPWSPQQEEVTDKLTSSRFRRMSEPLPKLSGEGNRYHNFPLSKTPVIGLRHAQSLLNCSLYHTTLQKLSLQSKSLVIKWQTLQKVNGRDISKIYWQLASKILACIDSNEVALLMVDFLVPACRWWLFCLLTPMPKLVPNGA